MLTSDADDIETMPIIKAARRFGISRSTLYRLKTAGLLKHHKLGRCTLVSVRELRALITGAPSPGPVPT